MVATRKYNGAIRRDTESVEDLDSVRSAYRTAREGAELHDPALAAAYKNINHALTPVSGYYDKLFSSTANADRGADTRTGQWTETDENGNTVTHVVTQKRGADGGWVDDSYYTNEQGGKQQVTQDVNGWRAHYRDSDPNMKWDSRGWWTNEDTKGAYYDDLLYKYREGVKKGRKMENEKLKNEILPEFKQKMEQTKQSLIQPVVDRREAYKGL